VTGRLLDEEDKDEGESEELMVMRKRKSNLEEG